MDDRQEWIERYDRGAGKPVDGFGLPTWPEILIEQENLECLIEGILAERVDWPAIVFESDPPPDEVLEAIEMMIRVPELQVRFAPEGCYLKSRTEILLQLENPEDPEDSFRELLSIESELCLSFTERFGVSPVVDIMGGEVVLVSNGATATLVPGTEIIDPERAVEWGLNGCDPEGW